MAQPVGRRALVAEAAATLAAGGVASPEADATTLLAHVLGTTRGGLALVAEVADEQATAYAGLVAATSRSAYAAGCLTFHQRTPPTWLCAPGPTPHQ